MMFINPESKLFKEQIRDLIEKRYNRLIVSKDYNDFTTMASFKDGILKISCTCFNYKSIFDIAGEQMLKKKYANYTIENPEEGFNLTISFNCDVIPEKPERPAEKTPEAEEAYNQQRAEVMKKQNDIISQVSSDFSSIRSNFYAAPFEYAMEKSQAKDPLPPFQMKTRDNEIIYVISQNDSISIFYEVYFADQVDRTLGNLILTEMVESKRHVKNAPGVNKSSHDAEALTAAFPNLKKDDKVTIINITLFSGNMTSGIVEKAALLAGMRQYIHYHVHSMKTYLHSRIIKRIQAFQRTLYSCCYEPEEDKKIEDEKQGTVWKK